MSQSFTCLRCHLVFSTKDRLPLIADSWRQRLHDYVGGIIDNEGGVLHAAGSVSDHIHLLTSISKNVALADTMRNIKANSSRWIHDTLGATNFAWQTGYAAFSVSFSATDAVRAYLAGQAEHHRKMTFKEELIAMLARHQIGYDERYMWD